MRQLIRQAKSLLITKNVPQVQNSIKIIRQQWFSKEISPRNIKSNKFKKSICLRSIHYPVQYLCRFWPFRQLNLRLKRPVLIPRFQSEYMIQILIKNIKRKYNGNAEAKTDSKIEIKQLKFVQFGCGSGALGLSLSKQLSIQGLLIDIDKRCIQLSGFNSKLNEIPANLTRFQLNDMTNVLNYVFEDQYDIIVSNPPYLSLQHYRKRLPQQIRKYQSINALVAQQGGLKYIRILTQAWKKRVKKGILMLQFDGRILKNELAYLEDYVIRDQYGRRRFILLQK